jgi:DUF4097 and DUF4098 domain-containing protein YvlB
MTKLFQFSGTLLFLLLAFVSCEDVSTPESYEYEETTSEIVPITTQEFLEIRHTNGNLEITGSDTASRFTMQITRRVKSYRSTANAVDFIDDINVNISTLPQKVEVKVDHPKDTKLDYEVDFVITGPIIYDYTVVQGNGNVHLKGVSRNVDITLGNGNTNADIILLNDCNVTLENGNGNIELRIPDITDAEVSAILGNGNLLHEGLNFTDLVSTSTSLQGILGEGNGSISISLGNGNIHMIGY